MRLKQVLGVLTLLLIMSTMGMAANSQLTNVSAAAQGNSTVITLHASGAFTHTEYRPTDTLLLVDLSGVSAGKWKELTKTLSLPGIASYHVIGYTGSTGAEVARVEMTIAPGAVVNVKEAGGALNIKVTGKGGEVAAAAVPATKPAEKAPVKKTEVAKLETPKVAPKAEVAKVETKPAVAKPVQESAPKVASETAVKPAVVTDVQVVRQAEGLNVEIEANGPVVAKASRLYSPARVMIDVENSVPSGRNRSIEVNSDEVKDVRLARFSDAPPVTRIVVDLAASREYELANEGNKVVLKVHAPKAAQKAAPAAVKHDAVAAKEQAPKPVVAAATEKEKSAKAAPVKHVEPVVAKVSKPAVVKQPEPVVAKVVPAAAKETKPTVAEVKPAVEKPVQQKAAEPVVMAAAKPASAPVQKEADSKPEDFVMVEPTYHEPAAAPVASVNDPKAAADAAAKVMQSSIKAPETNSLLPTVSASMAPQAAQNLPQQQAAAQANAAPAKPKYTGEPISVNLKDVDLKDFFRLVHEISGLNIVLDPNVKGTLTLVLDDVPWDQALDLVLANNGLDRTLEGNVLRIATVDTLRKEAEAIRAKNEAEALSVPKVTITHFLSYARSGDVVPTIKRFLSQRGDVIADTRTNALIIQDIPAVMPEIQKLLVQLDRKTQEVEIEARVIAATRSFARDIGTQLGLGWGNGVSAIGGATAAGTSPTQVNGLTPNYIITGTNQIPLFTNMPAQNATSGLTFVNATNNYRIDAILTMAESRGLVKILSRPRVVTQNNVQAVVRQGLRVPVVTAAQLGGPPTTTYIEAFLRLTVTPQITVENTIFLNLDVENTTPDFSNEVLGNPTLITQQATTSVLVTDGGTAVIGGVIQTQNSVSTQQVPLLGSVPVLGNLFKRRTVKTSTQELLFFVTPRIVQT
jgi:type IV pilus assembly protein PilQ